MPNLAASPQYILLAEDNAADVLLVREALANRQVPLDLQLVEDGEQAIAFLQRIDRDLTLACPSLLLLDLHLPKRNGEEVMRSLRASERCGRTPVVILTSSDSPGDRDKARKGAALHYFRKPSTLQQFMELGDIVKDIIGPDAGVRSVDTAS